MGSLFSPSVPSYSPVSYTPQVVSAPKQTPTQPTEKTQQNRQAETPDEEVIRDVIKRSTRGRSSLIQTSYRGVLGEASTPTAPQRKSLLGE